MKKETLLLTPGPTPIPETVRRAMAQPLCHHRTEHFRTIVEDVVGQLRRILQTEQDVFLISSSGTGAMEAAFVNIVSPGDEVIIVDGGKFGHRFCDFATAYGITAHVVTVPWGATVDPAAIRVLIEQYPRSKAVFTTLCETSTGVCFPIREVAAVVRETDALLVVDAISGLAADVLMTDTWGVDVVIAGSQKALMTPPGLGIISVSEKAWPVIEQAQSPRFYFDLRRYRDGLVTYDTPFTPATTLVLGLQAAGECILAEGMESVWQRHAGMAAATRDALGALGLSLFAARPSQALSVALLPEGIDGKAFLALVRDEYGVILAGGQGHCKGKIFRMAHMGAVTEADILRGIAAVEHVLSAMGYRECRGEGVAQFQRSLAALKEQAIEGNPLTL